MPTREPPHTLENTECVLARRTRQAVRSCKSLPPPVLSAHAAYNSGRNISCTSRLMNSSSQMKPTTTVGKATFSHLRDEEQKGESESAALGGGSGMRRSEVASMHVNKEEGQSGGHKGKARKETEQSRDLSTPARGARERNSAARQGCFTREVRGRRREADREWRGDGSK
eukprot:3251220-Pleurochrysis_carterae.AAC.5